jgi:hypothetical protein
MFGAIMAAPEARTITLNIVRTVDGVYRVAVKGGSQGVADICWSRRILAPGLGRVLYYIKRFWTHVCC